MNVSLVRLTQRQWERIEDPRVEPRELWRGLPFEAVAEAMPDVEPDLMKLLLMRYREGLSLSEIARQTSLPIGTVAARIVHGHQRIRWLLRSRLLHA